MSAVVTNFPPNNYPVRCMACNHTWTGTLDDKCPKCIEWTCRDCDKNFIGDLDSLCPNCKPPTPEKLILQPPAEPSPSKPSILTDAASIISGPRRESYGPVEESFSKVATVASALLRRKLSAPLDGKDVAMFMLAMKLCREANLPAYDNRLDAIGYLALLDQLHAANPNQEPSK